MLARSFLKSTICLCALGFLFPILARANNYTLDQDLGGPQSAYTAPLLKLLKTPSDAIPQDTKQQSTPVKIQCYSNAENSFYIGVGQFMEVDASLQRLAEVIENFSMYSSFVKNNLKTELKDRDGNRFSVFSEMHISMPLVKNDRTDVRYVVVQESPQKRLYRFQLLKGNHLQKKDGIIILESLSDKRTKFTRLNFWDANWGIAKALAPEKIWRDSVKGLYQADLAFKLIAENPEMELKKVAETSQSETEKVNVVELLNQKKDFLKLMEEKK